MNGIASLGFQHRQPQTQNNHSFVYFSPNTQGSSGRPVYIHARLLPRFLSLVDVDSYQGMRVIAGIEQLRAIGGGISSYQSTVRAARHMSLIEGIAVYYYIAQHPQESRQEATGLYITDLRQDTKDKGSKPNIYAIGGMLSKPEATGRLEFSKQHASICADEDVAAAAESTLEHTPTDGWQAAQETEMLFIPNRLMNQFGSWLSPAEKSINSIKIARQIAQVLINTQKSRATNKAESALLIQIMGDASRALHSALHFCNCHLDKLDFEFIEPTAKMDSLLLDLKSKNAKASKPIVSTSKKSLVALAQVRQQLLTLIESQRNADQRNLSKATAKAAGAIKAAQGTSSNFTNAVRQANRLGRWDK